MKVMPLLLSLFLLCCFLDGQEPDYTLLRKKMVAEQLFDRGIIDKYLLNAFLKVQRHLFVKPQFRKNAYNDSLLDIGEEQTMNEPYIVAIMTQAVSPNRNKKVLEIGTGSGYHAAILAELFKNVYTIERIEKLAQEAKKCLDKMGYKNIKVKIGDGYEGWKKYSPYDAIIVTVSDDHIPLPLIEQLAVGGHMVIPVSYSDRVQELILLEKEADGSMKKTQLIPVQFVPLIRGKDAP